MFTIIGTAAGAAAMKLLNRKHVPQDMKELKKQEEELRKLVKEMEKSQKETTAEKEAALVELRKQAEELRAQVAEVLDQKRMAEVKMHGMEQDHATLVEQSNMAKAAFEQREVHLKSQNAALEQRTALLTNEMEALKADHDETVKEFQDQLDELRHAISDVVTRMLEHRISDADAAASVRALGCEIEYIEAPAAAVEQAAAESAGKEPVWSCQPGLLLGSAEGREKLQRLMVSGMMRNMEAADTAGGAARIPLITFPSRLASQRAPSGTGLLTRGASGTTPKKAAAGSLDQAPSADVSSTQRDQQPAAPATAAPAASRSGSSSVPMIKTGTTPVKAKPQPTSAGIQWTYSLQGGKGSTYVAKVPATGGDHTAPAAYFSSGSPASLLTSSSSHADDSSLDMPFTTSNTMGMIARP